MVMTTAKKTYSLIISLSIFTLGLLFGPLAEAATASVSTNRLSKEEVFQLKIVAEENLDSDDIDFSVLQHDFYTGTPHFGFYTNITNGKKTVRSEWTLGAGLDTSRALKNARSDNGVRALHGNAVCRGHLERGA